MRILTTVALGAATVLLAACGASSPPKETGFLSDYSSLRAVSPTSKRFVDDQRLKLYDSFIIEPVRVRFVNDDRVSFEQGQRVAEEFHAALERAIAGRYKVVQTPSKSAARVRAAITNLKRSSSTGPDPLGELLGVAFGEASIEAEIVDSELGSQIAALVEARRGSAKGASNDTLDDARAVMDEWAQRFRKTIDDAHGG